MPQEHLMDRREEIREKALNELRTASPDDLERWIVAAGVLHAEKSIRAAVRAIGKVQKDIQELFGLRTIQVPGFSTPKGFMAFVDVLVAEVQNETAPRQNLECQAA